jgi:hypothetical protein
MTEKTVRFGWWKNQHEIVGHEVIFSIPTFQTVKVPLGQWVTDFVISGLASQYPHNSPNNASPPVCAHGKASCEVDLPAGTFVASCGRLQNFEASATVTYRV